MKDFTEYYRQYSGKWIALNSSLNKVLGKGKTAKDAHREATKKGENNPTLFKVPDRNIPYVG